jgi:hypothetical protein
MTLHFNPNGFRADERRTPSAAEKTFENSLALRTLVQAAQFPTARRSVWRKDGSHWPAGCSMLLLA